MPGRPDEREPSQGRRISRRRLLRRGAAVAYSRRCSGRRPARVARSGRSAARAPPPPDARAGPRPLRDRRSGLRAAAQRAGILRRRARGRLPHWNPTRPAPRPASISTPSTTWCSVSRGSGAARRSGAGRRDGAAVDPAAQRQDDGRPLDPHLARPRLRPPGAGAGDAGNLIMRAVRETGRCNFSDVVEELHQRRGECWT